MVTEIWKVANPWNADIPRGVLFNITPVNGGLAVEPADRSHLRASWPGRQVVWREVDVRRYFVLAEGPW